MSPGPHGEAGRSQVVVQLGVDQVDLAQVGLARVTGHPGAVLDRHPGVCVMLDAHPFEQRDRVVLGLAELMLRAAVYRHHFTIAHATQPARNWRSRSPGYCGGVREDWRSRPHPARLPLDQPGRAQLLAAHAAAMAAGQAFYRDPLTGLYVLTAEYLANRGSCCDSGCRHCPYLEEVVI